MTIMITGFSGFVSRHFLSYLAAERIDIKVVGMDVKPPCFDYESIMPKDSIEFRIVDLLDFDLLQGILEEYKPDMILHLASYSSVAYSWKNPTESFKNNTNIFLNLLTAVQKACPECRILSIGSSEEYGRIGNDDVPIKERLKLNPISPYAVARVSQELMSKVYVDSYGLNIVLTRSFNHIGPWQDGRFAVPGFALRILDIKNSGKKKGVIKTGDLSVVRDFIDVRDVVRAYWILLNKGRVGEIYNICSGRGIALSEIVIKLAEIIGVEVTTEVDPEYLRPNDNPVIIGENYKIKSEFGWKPEIDIEITLRDLVDDLNR